MYKSYRLIFWGAIISFVNINIGWLNLMPTFAGYILIAVGLSRMAAVNQDAANSARKASAFAWVLAIYSFIMIFMWEFLDGITSYFLTSAFMTADMLMCCIILISGYQCAKNEEILKQRKSYLIIAAIAIASYCASIIIPLASLIALCLGLGSKAYFIYLCSCLKNRFKNSIEAQ